MSLETRHVDVGDGGAVSQTSTIPASPTVISFGTGCTQVAIQNQSASAILYIRYNGATCTTADFSIVAGSSFVRDGCPITQVCILGSAASGNYAIYAH